jgi:hypothetical protein
LLAGEIYIVEEFFTKDLINKNQTETKNKRSEVGQKKDKEKTGTKDKKYLPLNYR